MSALYSARGNFDSWIYWTMLLFVGIFMTYFLTSMIKLADTEDPQYDPAMLASYEHAGILRHHNLMKKDTAGYTANSDGTPNIDALP